MKLVIWKEAEDRYCAVLGDWWLAFGTSPENAKKNVIKRYEKEMEYR